MTERERLIEILSVPIHPRIGADPAEVVADYLLDNGVIVPPCDSGDEIYYVIGKDKIYKSVCCAFSHDAFNNLIIIDEFYGCHTEERVFLTYEEAESAVKEREYKC